LGVGVGDGSRIVDDDDGSTDTVDVGTSSSTVDVAVAVAVGVACNRVSDSGANVAVGVAFSCKNSVLVALSSNSSVLVASRTEEVAVAVGVASSSTDDEASSDAVDVASISDVVGTKSTVLVAFSSCKTSVELTASSTPVLVSGISRDWVGDSVALSSTVLAFAVASSGLADTLVAVASSSAVALVSLPAWKNAVVVGCVLDDSTDEGSVTPTVAVAVGCASDVAVARTTTLVGEKINDGVGVGVTVALANIEDTSVSDASRVLIKETSAVEDGTSGVEEACVATRTEVAVTLSVAATTEVTANSTVELAADSVASTTAVEVATADGVATAMMDVAKTDSDRVAVDDWTWEKDVVSVGVLVGVAVALAETLALALAETLAVAVAETLTLALEDTLALALALAERLALAEADGTTLDDSRSELVKGSTLDCVGRLDAQ
jgi:hypothetical protein